MKKLLKTVFRTLTFVFVCLFGVNTFAVAVSDNDGSAFITKAEFDSLKNSFQNQIDSYNNGIDNKINDAIASYLSGIRISSENRLNLCSGLKYPLTLRHLGPYNGYDVANITSLDDAAKLWTDDLDVDFNLQRHALSGFTPNPISKNPNNRIKNFYNGYKMNVNDFLINNMWNDYNVIGVFNSCFHHFSYTTTANEYWGWTIALDVASDDSSGGQTQNNYWTRTTLANNARRKTFPSDSRPYNEAVWGQYSPSYSSVATTQPTYSSSAGNKYNTVSYSQGQGWIEHTVVWVQWSQSAEKKTSDINDVLVSKAKGAVNTELYLPVLYDGKVKVTNINTAKTNINPDILYCTTNYDGTETIGGGYHYGIHGVFDAGYVIDPENNKAAGTTWDSTSLITGSRLKYKEKTPYSNAEKICTMGEGILLTEMKKDIESAELVFKPRWDTTKETATSRKKYIMLSKSPITEDFTNIADSTNPNVYIDISTSLNGPKAKLIELNNNVENKIYIGELKKR